MPLLSFKGVAQAYLLKISIIHNKNLNPLLNLLDNCISAKSTPQILSLNEEYTFLFLNLLIIALWSSSANCILFLLLAASEAEKEGWYKVEEEWQPLPCDFLSKKIVYHWS